MVPTILLDDQKTLESGDLGRPCHYPNIENYPNLLFYIQRSQNINAVVYEVNCKYSNILDLNNPIHVKWLKYDDQGNEVFQELNYIQNKLAYGYRFKVISHDLIEFCFVSYENMKFFLCRDHKNNFRVSSLIDGAQSIVERIYIYAEELGIFPQVKFAEIFGKHPVTHEKVYKKLSFE